MATDAKKIVRNWWHKQGDYQLMSKENQYQQLARLDGFLDSCEEFGHLGHTEALIIFNELVDE
jgi:hypothetical protein